jgi:hypothetical protein
MYMHWQDDVPVTQVIDRLVCLENTVVPGVGFRHDCMCTAGSGIKWARTGFTRYGRRPKSMPLLTQLRRATAT